MSDLTATAADIEVEVPLRFERASTIRVVAASLAADAGFSIDEIDDLRLAISEVFSMLVDAAPDERVRIRFAVTEAAVEVVIGHVDGAVDVELDELAANILGAVLDDFSVAGGAIRLYKRATESTS